MSSCGESGAGAALIAVTETCSCSGRARVRYLNVSPSAKALKKEREELHETTDHRQCSQPIPQLIAGLNCWWHRAKGPEWQRHEGPRRHVLMSARCPRSNNDQPDWPRSAILIESREFVQRSHRGDKGRNRQSRPERPTHRTAPRGGRKPGDGNRAAGGEVFEANRTCCAPERNASPLQGMSFREPHSRGP